MSTSNSFSYTDSTDTIITDAFIFTGKYGEDEPPSNADYNLALRVLNRMAKSWMVKNDRSPGMKVWQRQQGFLFLQSNTGQYVLNASAPWWANTFTTLNTANTNANGALNINVGSTTSLSTGQNLGIVLDSNYLQWTTIENVVNSTFITISTGLLAGANSNNLIYLPTGSQPPQVIDWVSLRDSNGNDVFVDILTYEEFVSLPSKQSPVYQGTPAAVYYESHLVDSTPFGYLNTDVNGSVDLTRYLVVNFIRELQDWVNPSDAPDFPKEWYEALVFNLGKRLAPMIGAVWTQTQEELAKDSLLNARSANPKRLAYRFTRNRMPAWRNPPHR